MKTRGFTLIELLVVIAIIGVLSSVVLASLNTARSRARDASRRAAMNQIVVALALYYDANGSYPLSGGCRSDSWCVDNQQTNWIPGLQTYLNPQPHDLTPYGANLAPFHYHSNGTGYFLGTSMENPQGTCTTGVIAPWYYGDYNTCTWWGGNLYSKSSTN
ncbi:MAG: ral secretion pathway protein [Patescibacteria group bacterium]|nr:ral secretion pathway protein [Patescibacteria group bacterium]